MLEARNRAGLTQQQVADALGLSQGTVAEAESTALSSGYTPLFAELYKCDPLQLAVGIVGTQQEGKQPAKSKGQPSDADLELLNVVKTVMSIEEIHNLYRRYEAFVELQRNVHRPSGRKRPAPERQLEVGPQLAGSSKSKKRSVGE